MNFWRCKYIFGKSRLNEVSFPCVSILADNTSDLLRMPYKDVLGKWLYEHPCIMWHICLTWQCIVVYIETMQFRLKVCLTCVILTSYDKLACCRQAASIPPTVSLWYNQGRHQRQRQLACRVAYRLHLFNTFRPTLIPPLPWKTSDAWYFWKWPVFETVH